MFKKLLNLLLGKKDVSIEAPLVMPEISIHEDIVKTLEEIKETREESAPIAKATRVKKEKPKTPKKSTKPVVKTTAKKKVSPVTATKEKAKRGPKKTK